MMAESDDFKAGRLLGRTEVLEDIAKDHETRLRWVEKLSYGILGILAVVQIILPIVQEGILK